MGRDDVETRIAARAASQHGLVTRQQLLAMGVTDKMIHRRVRSCGWDVVQPGVYRLGGVPPSWRQALHGAVLAAGPEAIVSHRAAAALWGLEGFRPGLVEISSPRWLRRPRGDGIVLHETQDLLAADCDQLDGLPVAVPLRIALDIGCLVSPSQVEMVVVESMRRGWFTHRQLLHRYRQIARPGRNGSRAIRLILDGFDTAERQAHSGWEIRLARLITRLGFPRPERQIRLRGPDGDLIAQVDLGYRAARVAIEADSESWHTGREPFHRDRTRWNNITAQGWEVLIYTYEHYRHDHEHIRRTLAASLARRIA